MSAVSTSNWNGRRVRRGRKGGMEERGREELEEERRKKGGRKEERGRRK